MQFMLECNTKLQHGTEHLVMHDRLVRKSTTIKQLITTLISLNTAPCTEHYTHNRCFNWIALVIAIAEQLKILSHNLHAI